MPVSIDIKTKSQIEFIDITSNIQQAVDRSGIKEGVCYVYVPHTTAAVTINENADPDVIRDIITRLNEIVPLDGNYRHTEGNSAAHIKASIVGSSETIFIEDGRLVLGAWQSIFFCEFDGQRSRRAMVKIVSG
ncbi:MAG: YjbQ family protein [Nitrospirae bacterium]|nr:YjbQ family protein [Nitrospirota bacterium]